MKKDTYVVIAGDVFRSGVIIYGPFESYEAAVNWVDANETKNQRLLEGNVIRILHEPEN